MCDLAAVRDPRGCGQNFFHDPGACELLEVTSCYPNGAREHWLDSSLEDADALPLETVGFTGKEADEEVGLTYFGHRYLIQRIGRWATPDPLAIHAMGGGEAGNSYHYVSGNLLQGRDPLGLEEPRPADSESKPEQSASAEPAPTPNKGIKVAFYTTGDNSPMVNDKGEPQRMTKSEGFRKYAESMVGPGGKVIGVRTAEEARLAFENLGTDTVSELHLVGHGDRGRFAFSGRVEGDGIFMYGAPTSITTPVPGKLDDANIETAMVWNTAADKLRNDAKVIVEACSVGPQFAKGLQEYLSGQGDKAILVGTWSSEVEISPDGMRVLNSAETINSVANLGEDAPKAVPAPGLPPIENVSTGPERASRSP